MQGSPLSLLTWFAALRHIVADTSTGSAELKTLLSLSRPATAQAMPHRIRQAIQADEAGEQLAILGGLSLVGQSLNLLQAIFFRPNLQNENDLQMASNFHLSHKCAGT